jgi:hypothetical protein
MASLIFPQHSTSFLLVKITVSNKKKTSPSTNSRFIAVLEHVHLLSELEKDSSAQEVLVSKIN